MFLINFKTLKNFSFGKKKIATMADNGRLMEFFARELVLSLSKDDVLNKDVLIVKPPRGTNPLKKKLIGKNNSFSLNEQTKFIHSSETMISFFEFFFFFLKIAFSCYFRKKKKKNFIFKTDKHHNHLLNIISYQFCTYSSRIEKCR